MRDISRKLDSKVSRRHRICRLHANIGFSDILIVNTNSDLNMYKEMWQKENAEPTPVKSSCCGTATSLNDIKEAEGLPDVDFNLWTGELQRIRLDHKLQYLLPCSGSFKIFAVKPRSN